MKLRGDREILVLVTNRHLEDGFHLRENIKDFSGHWTSIGLVHCEFFTSFNTGIQNLDGRLGLIGYGDGSHASENCGQEQGFDSD